MWSYLLALTIPISAWCALHTEHEGLFLLALLFLVPVLDEILGPNNSDVPVSESSIAARLAFHVPHLFTLLWWMVLWEGGQHLQSSSSWQLASIMLTSGLVSAISTVHSHEFIHRPCKWSVMVGESSFAISGYPGFAICHSMHHAKTGYEEFGHAPRLGLSFWRHLPKSYVNTVMAGWRYERRLRGLSWRNRVLRLSAISVGCLVVSTMLWGVAGLAYYLSIVVITTFVVELIGYLQHYGFSRDSSSGKNRVVAWDCNNWFTNRLFINNPLHAAHHGKPMAWYANSRPGNALLPAGYLTLMWVALVPPLWFSIMDHRAKAVG